MNEPIDSNLKRQLEEEFPELRLSLSRMPHRTAPPALMRKLKRQFIGRPWLDIFQSWFTWPTIWKPVGALTLAALLAGVWLSRWKASEKEFIDVQPLVTAHSRYQAEALVPPGDMAGSNFGAQLAVYYGDEK